MSSDRSIPDLDEVDGALERYVVRRRVRNRITLVVITMWVQLWFEIWWLSLLVFVLAGLASEWAWRRGGPSYEHQRSDLMDEVLYEQRTGRRSGQAG